MQSKIIPWLGHFWSLCVEEHFYLVIPFLVKILNKKVLIVLLCLLVLVTFIIPFLELFSIDVPFILSWSSIRFSGALALGGLIAIVYRSNMKYFVSCLSISKKIILPVCIINIIVITLYFKIHLDGILTLTSLLLYVPLIVLSIDETPKLKILTNKYISYLGVISYGIYVYHGALWGYGENYVRPFLNNYIRDTNIVYIIIMASFSVILATLSYRFIEKPILNVKKLFHY